MTSTPAAPRPPLPPSPPLAPASPASTADPSSSLPPAPSSSSSSAPPTSTTPAATPVFSCPPSDNPSLGPLAMLVLPRVFKLYNLSAGAVDFEVYHKDATFEDPLMKAEGIKQIKSAFYSMQVLFKQAEISEYTVTELQTAPNSGQVVVDNRQHYQTLGWSFDVVSRIKLDVKDGFIAKHQDLWDKKPLATKEGEGALGWVAQGCRKVNMFVTHSLMGFGRDLKSGKR